MSGELKRGWSSNFYKRLFSFDIKSSNLLTDDQHWRTLRHGSWSRQRSGGWSNLANWSSWAQRKEHLMELTINVTKTIHDPLKTPMFHIPYTWSWSFILDPLHDHDLWYIYDKYTIHDIHNHDPSIQIPYTIMMLICLAGSIATSFLPETLGAKLPETLEVSSFWQNCFKQGLHLVVICSCWKLQLNGKTPFVSCYVQYTINIASIYQDANQFGRTDKYFSLKPNRGWGQTFSFISQLHFFW